MKVVDFDNCFVKIEIIRYYARASQNQSRKIISKKKNEKYIKRR